MTRLLRSLRYLLQRDRHDRELDDELQFHLERACATSISTPSTSTCRGGSAATERRGARRPGGLDWENAWQLSTPSPSPGT